MLLSAKSAGQFFWETGACLVCKVQGSGSLNLQSLADPPTPSWNAGVPQISGHLASTPGYSITLMR